MEKRAFKDAIYAQLARIGKALDSPKRLEMLDLLCQRSWTVEELAAEAHLSVANASRHLQVLRTARLVESVRRGMFVEYSVSDEKVCEVCRGIRTLAESQLAEIDRITTRFADGRDEFVSIDRETLLQRMSAGSVVLLDVRPVEEFRAAHLAGAVSIPITSLESRLDELPRRRKIVAYCRGPYCLFASEAVRILRDNGFDAVRFEEGVVDWRAEGLQLESGDGPGRAARGAARTRR